MQFIITLALFAVVESFRLALHRSSVQSSRLSMTSSYDVDVAVVGGGPAGTVISWLLQEQQKCKVAMIDPNGNKETCTWYANYGEWKEEWDALSERMKLPELKDCTTTEWPITDTYFGGSNGIPMEKRDTLDRGYIRVDRIKMQKLLKDRFRKSNGVTIPSKIEASLIANNIFDKNLVHSASGSTLTLADGSTVSCKVVIDASGLESRLVAREKPYYARGVNSELPTGYQIAYGFLTKVNSMGPYQPNAMTLFDYRTDHFDGDQEWLKDAIDRPTFMYVMPLEDHKDGTYTVFWEETSLVGKDERRLSFEECKKRAYRRLEHHGIQVLGVEEEEFCYIPMGGELPDSTQRVIAFGGAANTVHPATGYQANRMMAASTELAAVVGRGIRDGQAPDGIANDAYNALWSQKTRGQRDFQSYGGDFLMRQPVTVLRGFFSAFFAVDQPVWSGFLAGYPGLPYNEYHETATARLSFAIGLFLKMPNDVRLAMMLYAVQYSFEFGPNVLLRSLLPILFGPGPPNNPEWKLPTPAAEFGDPTAKAEARRLIASFTPSGCYAETATEIGTETATEDDSKASQEQDQAEEGKEEQEPADGKETLLVGAATFGDIDGFPSPFME